MQLTCEEGLLGISNIVIMENLSAEIAELKLGWKLSHHVVND